MVWQSVASAEPRTRKPVELERALYPRLRLLGQTADTEEKRVPLMNHARDLIIHQFVLRKPKLAEHFVGMLAHFRSAS